MYMDIQNWANKFAFIISLRCCNLDQSLQKRNDSSESLGILSVPQY